MKSKYHSHSFDNVHGHFDSKLEYSRYLFLLNAEKKGVISNIRRQVVYELIPSQTVMVTKHLKTKDKLVERVAERPCTYLADFVYTKQDKEIIEDTKGMRTKDYIIKRKLMRFQGHPIREISKSTDEI